jgi:hypothetical protein
MRNIIFCCTKYSLRVQGITKCIEHIFLKTVEFSSTFSLVWFVKTTDPEKTWRHHNNNDMKYGK